ncbi:MAG: DUF2786 domain-containing protein [Rhodospirillaceae bacterium]
MTQAERERFHNLLLMAKESPFEGERRNALDAAGRLAARHGLTLEEAARSGGEALQRAPPAAARPRSTFDDAAAESATRERLFAEMARFMRNMEDRARSEKARRDEALRAAYERGLDAEERRQAERRAARDHIPRRRNGHRRNPRVHADVLLRETQLPLDEIASICGLDVWTVAGLKLKMRG